MVSELNFPSCPAPNLLLLLPHAAFSPASTVVSISQLWQLQNCYKFHTFPHASQRCVPATLAARHSTPQQPMPLCLFSSFFYLSQSTYTVSSVSDLLEITLTAIHFSRAFVFYYLPLLSFCYAIIICSMPCKIVGVIVMRGTRQVASWGRVSCSETSSCFAVGARNANAREL